MSVGEMKLSGLPLTITLAPATQPLTVTSPSMKGLGQLEPASHKFVISGPEELGGFKNPPLPVLADKACGRKVTGPAEDPKGRESTLRPLGTSGACRLLSPCGPLRETCSVCLRRPTPSTEHAVKCSGLRALSRTPLRGE